MLSLLRRLLGGQPAPRFSAAHITYLEGGRARSSRERRRRQSQKAAAAQLGTGRRPSDEVETHARTTA